MTTLTIELTPDVYARLEQKGLQQGKPAAKVAQEYLQQWLQSEALSPDKGKAAKIGDTELARRRQQLLQRLGIDDAELARRRQQTFQGLEDTLRQMASEQGVPFEAFIAARYQNCFARPAPDISPAALEAAHKELRQYAGSVSLGYATGTDNEAIDTDLARECMETHEETP